MICSHSCAGATSEAKGRATHSRVFHVGQAPSLRLFRWQLHQRRGGAARSCRGTKARKEADGKKKHPQNSWYLRGEVGLSGCPGKGEGGTLLLQEVAKATAVVRWQTIPRSAASPIETKIWRVPRRSGTHTWEEVGWCNSQRGEGRLGGKEREKKKKEKKEKTRNSKRVAELNEGQRQAELHAEAKHSDESKQIALVG